MLKNFRASLQHARRGIRLAVREVGQGRTLAVTTDASWRWGFVAAEGGQGNRAYLKFWNAALRWLVRDPGLAPLQVEPDAPAVDIAVKGGAVLVPNLAFGKDAGPLPVDAAKLLEATGTASQHFRRCDELVRSVSIRRLKRTSLLQELPDVTKLLMEESKNHTGVKTHAAV